MNGHSLPTARYYTEYYGNIDNREQGIPPYDFFIVKYYEDGHIEIEHQGAPVSISDIEVHEGGIARCSFHIEFSYYDHTVPREARWLKKTMTLNPGIVLIVHDDDHFTRRFGYSSQSEATPAWAKVATKRKRSLTAALIDGLLYLVLRLPDRRRQR